MGTFVFVAIGGRVMSYLSCNEHPLVGQSKESCLDCLRALLKAAFGRTASLIVCLFVFLRAAELCPIIRLYHWVINQLDAT